MSFNFTPKTYHMNCTRCGAQFIAHSNRAKYCKTCKVEINREKVRAYRENPPADYKARQSESFKRWYQKNRRRVIKSVCEHRKEYWWRNHERMLEYAHEYYQKNRELITLNRRINYYDKCVASYYKDE